MRTFSLIALVAGLGAATVLIGHFGFMEVAAALWRVGWIGFLAITGIHLAISVVCSVAWFIVVPKPARPSVWVFIWGRLVRSGGAEVLPLSQLGGFVMGARAASVAGMSGKLAVASSVVDAMMEFLAQLAFAALGLGFFAALRPQSDLVRTTALGLGAAVAIAALFILAQRRAFAVIERIANGIAQRQAGAVAKGFAALQASLDEINRRRGSLLVAFQLHLLCWLAGAAEIWFALILMGRPLAVGPVLAIEGLLCTARVAAFAVPSALGVQEGVYVILGGLFGLGPDAALALSLLKRARDLALGAPALLAWQLVEGRQLWTRPRAGAREIGPLCGGSTRAPDRLEACRARRPIASAPLYLGRRRRRIKEHES
jgi:glycosyltransferase 2 family protein